MHTYAPVQRRMSLSKQTIDHKKLDSFFKEGRPVYNRTGMWVRFDQQAACSTTVELEHRIDKPEKRSCVLTFDKPIASIGCCPEGTFSPLNKCPDWSTTDAMSETYYNHMVTIVRPEVGMVLSVRSIGKFPSNAVILVPLVWTIETTKGDRHAYMVVKSVYVLAGRDLLVNSEFPSPSPLSSVSQQEQQPPSPPPAAAALVSEKETEPSSAPVAHDDQPKAVASISSASSESEESSICATDSSTSESIELDSGSASATLSESGSGEELSSPDDAPDGLRSKPMFTRTKRRRTEAK